MYEFRPKSVLFEEAALDYPLGRSLKERFEAQGIPTGMIASHNRVTGIRGATSRQAFAEAKKTLVVGVRRSSKFEGCKPSAHYQLPLATSCPGMCEYCYLQTTLGKKPYLRVYVNIDEILEKASEYIEERKPEITLFEGAATSDPLPTEIYTGALAKTIAFFARQEYARFRFVTKFTCVDPLLRVDHNGHTRFRFSLNSAPVVNRYEHLTPPMEERLEAAGKVSSAGYPLGFIIAPVFYYEGWEDDYGELLEGLRDKLAPGALGDLTFEIITHRYTPRAKSNILELFPETTLPMDEEGRRYKYGQFGYGKYVYTPERMSEMKEYLTGRLSDLFPGAKVEYFV